MRAAHPNEPNSAIACSPCFAEAKSAAPVKATAGAALDARGYRHGNRAFTWLIPGLSDRLTALHAGQLSFRAIAATLSREFNVKLSRNACIGRAKRLHLPERQSPIHLAPARPKKQKSDRLCLPRKAALHPRLPAQVRLVAIAKRPGRSLNLTIAELHIGVCKWPYGHNPPFKYCGRPSAAGHSWCPEHDVLAHIKAREMRP